MRRVVILGAGFGGLAAARALRSRLPAQDEVILVDRQPSFVMGLRKWWAIVGRSSLDEGRRELNGLTESGIGFIQAEVESIDPASRSVVVGGKSFEADALLIALGAEHTPEAVPGLREHAYNPYDSAAIPAVIDALRAFPGGRLGIGIFGVPYTCPPAPYELALLLREELDRRGLETEIEVFTPTPVSLPVIGKENCAAIEGLLQERGVGFLPERRVASVRRGEVVFTTGPRSYDLLLGIPPHRCPRVLSQAGLAADGGWVRVDLRSMETMFPGVYAIGDVTEIPLANGMPLPKAGVFAEGGAEVAVEAILAAFAGQDAPRRFEGHGFCYLEAGRGQALEVRGHFLAEPRPAIDVSPPSAESLKSKQAFERDRLRAWFGA